MAMISDNYYHITALPTLADLGSTPPLTARELLERLEAADRPRALVQVLLLLDDLLMREAFLSGEIKDVEPVILTPAQARNEEPLPAFLVVDTERSVRTIDVDHLWDAYFRYAAGTAKEHNSNFLFAWTAHEVALRNALAVARADQLGLQGEDYLVADDLADHDADFTNVMTEWTAAPTPLAGLQVLIQTRWRWINEHDAWFTFKDDELTAYAVRLMLLWQWHRLTQAERDKTTGRMADNAAEPQERTRQ